jgi:hypothetical protein
MKTHNYGPNLALLAAACSLAACTDSTPVVNATAPEAATASALAPSGGVGAAGTSTRAINSGKYHVCAVSEDTRGHRHSNMTGVHIEKGAEVEIKKINADTATLVCLGGPCPTDPMNPAFREKVLWMTGDTNNLRTVRAFAHTDKTSNAPVDPMPQHLVQLMSDADIPVGCNSQKNVLMLRFCEWAVDDDTGNADWLCAGPDPHAGAVHLEP